MGSLLILVGVLVVLQVVRRAARTKAAPERITLERVSATMKEAAAAQALAAPLVKEGFRDIGTYRVNEMRLLIRGFCHPTAHVYAVVYDRIRADIPPFVDLVTRYEDGGSVTYTSNAYMGAAALDRPPGREKVSDPGADPAALFRRLLAERPDRPVSPAPPQEFQARFETAYAEEMSWRAQERLAGATRKTRGVDPR